MPPKKDGTKDWEVKTFPKFSGKKAFVLPGAFYGQCVLLMAEAGFSKADNVADADVVVFIGGEDVNPKLYNQDNVASGFDDARDALEVEIYNRAKELGKVCFGICRGAQFLHVMNGGLLWQDVNHHAGRSHSIIDLDEDVRLTVTSLHHQMLQDNDTLEVIAVTEDQIATTFIDADLHINLGKSNADHEIEIEAGCYHGTKSFFVQGHPEVGSLYYKTWSMQKLQDLMQEWESPAKLTEIVKGMSVCVV